jgi:hypothetical protein
VTYTRCQIDEKNSGEVADMVALVALVSCGALADETMVWTTGRDAWIEWADCKGLYFAPAPPTTRGPPPAHSADAVATQPPSAGPTTAVVVVAVAEHGESQFLFCIFREPLTITAR